MSAADSQDTEKTYNILAVFAIIMLGLNIYYFSHPFFDGIGLSGRFVRTLLLTVRRSGLYDNPMLTKGFALICIAIANMMRRGLSTERPVRDGLIAMAAGLAVYVLWPDNTILYMVTSIAGFWAIAWGVAILSRRMRHFERPDNDIRETFQQCEQKIETADSINLATEYQYQHRIHKGWINIVNPFRATMLLGTPGSGKSFSVFNQFIEQMIEKDYTMFCYDYKFPDLTNIVYNETLLKYRYDSPTTPRFYVINFEDPVYSHRCNPIHSRYITDPADSAEIAETIMANAAPSIKKKEDFFSMSAEVLLDAIIYFLSFYKGGRYCTFPHVIELMCADYKQVFEVLSNYDVLETKLKPFAQALKENTQEQLQGQIASAMIPLLKMASPALYWTLTGDDFTLDINNPKEPKIICMGNNPKRQKIYGTTLALFTSQMFKLINDKGKRKSGVLLDELPTIFIKGLDNLIATARSNKVAILFGAQDKTQLIRDYEKKDADVVFNTVGNIISGQVNGETARDLSHSFGKEFRMQQSQTQNLDSDSVSTSYHQIELMPIPKIETLSQGFFCGKIADNNDTQIERKFFCGEVKVDVKKWKQKTKNMKKLPVITDFGNDEIIRQVHEHDMAEAILEQWCRDKASRDSETFLTEESLSEEVQKLRDSLKKSEIDKILDEKAAELIKNNVKQIVQENYDKIRNDIKNIIYENIEQEARRNPELDDDYYGEQDDDKDENIEMDEEERMNNTLNNLINETD